MHDLLKKLVPALLLATLCTFAAAQGDTVHTSFRTTNNIRFQPVLNAGILFGQTNRDVQLQAIAGASYKAWAAGIGAGLDYYRFRGVPLFLDVRKQFQNPIPVFLYADIGWQLPWVKKSTTINWFQTETSYQKGLYYDFGAGWRFKTSRRNALLLSAGYSAKKVREVIKPINITEGSNGGGGRTESDYHLRRIALKLGFQF